ncbi:DUF4352 domain-containing protein [Kocuria sp. CPCC 205261]|uniref:DUF4352 domain-containing protein n=1 Tax=Kocuria TaxID=57493 RepID=UPI0034D5F8F9
MNKARILAVTTVISLGLVGCGGGVEIEEDAAPATANSPATMEEESSESSDVAQFGDTVVFNDGLAVTIQSGGLIEASEYAAGAVDGKIATVKVTVENRGDDPIDAAGISAFTATAGESGAPTTSAADEGIDNPTLGTVLPGNTKTGMYGFGLTAQDAQQIQIEVYGSDSSSSAVFTGAIE